MLENLFRRAGPRAAARVRLVHFADPFCWWSWGLEPALRRIEAVYGDQVAVDYRMGGVFTDINAWRAEYGVDEAGTLAWAHESAQATGHPIDPDYMRKTGVRSTYPACSAFKAAEIQDRRAAQRLLRAMMVGFQVECRPATEATLLEMAAGAGLSRDRLRRDLASPQVQRAFTADRESMAGAHATFLTLIVATDHQETVLRQEFRAGPIESAIDRLVPGLVKRIPSDLAEYLRERPGLTAAREVAEVFGGTDEDAVGQLIALEAEEKATSSMFSGSRFWSAPPEGQ